MATAERQSLELRHDGPIVALAVGEQDGQVVVFSGGTDGRVLAWEPRTQAASEVFGPGPAVTALAADENLLVCAWADGRARVWQGGRTVEQTLGFAPTSLAVERRLVWAADPAGAVVWLGVTDLVRQGELRVAHPVAVAERRGHVAVGGMDGVATLAAKEDSKPRWQARASASGPVNAVALLDGAHVVTGGADGTLRDWRRSDDFKLLAEGAAVTALDVRHFEGRSVIACRRADGTAQVIVRDGETFAVETGAPSGPVALLRSDDRLFLVTSGADGRPELANVMTTRDDHGPRADKVEWLFDAPSDDDLLRRRPLARALALRLERLQDGEQSGRSFLIHIDGAWGTGKSTILGYLGEELRDKWLVVDFNAWRRSRVGPPWWALLVALRDAVARERGWLGRLGLRLREAASQTRRSGGRSLIALVVAVAVAAALYLLLKPGDTKSIGDSARSIAAVLAGIGTLWAAGTVVARMMLWDSAKGAKVYEQAESDPMAHVAEHFAWLVERAGKPILFFVDDLDRCPGDYVVELLEAVQTLVRDDRRGGFATYFVIAADGSWVRVSYERRYADFCGSVGEPGRPLGYLFQDKLFQLSVRVPVVSELDQSQYLAGLLAVQRAAPDVRAEVEAAEKRLESGGTDAEVVAVLEAASPEAREVLRETAIDRLSDEGVQSATEHALQAYAGLLEPNPRAMKRFVNAFGLARVVLTLEDVLVSFDVLARWTILSTRWPMLADRLREHPGEIDGPGADADGIPQDVRDLLASREVRDVASGLSGEEIERCVSGRSATSAT